MCKLDNMKGLGLGETYRNTEAAKVFVKSICEVEFSNISNIIMDSKFLCVIGDGSIDSAIKEQEIWFMRSCNKGQINTSFIGVHAAERADANGIVKGLKETVANNLNIHWEDVSQNYHVMGPVLRLE